HRPLRRDAAGAETPADEQRRGPRSARDLETRLAKALLTPAVRKAGDDQASGLGCADDTLGSASDEHRLRRDADGALDEERRARGNRGEDSRPGRDATRGEIGPPLVQSRARLAELADARQPGEYHLPRRPRPREGLCEDEEAVDATLLARRKEDRPLGGDYI